MMTEGKKYSELCIAFILKQLIELQNKAKVKILLVQNKYYYPWIHIYCYHDHPSSNISWLYTNFHSVTSHSISKQSSGTHQFMYSFIYLF